MNAPIPAFVTRGVQLLTNPRDPSALRYVTEADLRDGMAMIWWLNGWNVRTEVKVPNCGRIDVLAECDDSSVVIELKKRIRSATEARQAYQQAHAYSAYLTSGSAWALHTFVTAGDINFQAIAAAERAYPSVWGNAFYEVVERATDPNVIGDGLQTLTWRSRQRARSLNNLADLARGAAAGLVIQSEATA